jgi:hypothetical protein
MHRLSVVILTILALSLGAAMAQQITTPPDPTDEEVEVDVFAPQVVITPPRTNWAGASLGINPLISGYFGIPGLIGDIDVRFRAGLNFLGGFGFNAGADALFNITTLDEINVYAGGGPSLSYSTWSWGVPGFAVVDVTSFGIGLSGLAGAEYRLDRNLGLFGELGLGLQYVSVSGAFDPAVPAPVISGIGADIRVAAGVNFHF